MNSERWVTALDVAKDTAYRCLESKGLPAHTIGRLWQFQLSDVDEWMGAGGAEDYQDRDNGEVI